MIRIYSIQVEGKLNEVIQTRTKDPLPRSIET